MSSNQYKLRLVLHATFTLAAMVILVDFVAPGRIINDEIINVQRNRQQYYNAGGNHHYSYKVITSEHGFLVETDFAKLELTDKEIEYSVSPIFKEVNWYRLPTSRKKSFHSLRIASGLVLPLLLIISIVIAYRFKKNIGTLLFILQTLLIADLILLMT
ncbi:hypothetical protein [Flagellimonas sp.]|uniref:hypothetical protein n=1 Tax=Flagellimonas sp. TaxID=2058762 RepID=UPI003B5AC3EC